MNPIQLSPETLASVSEVDQLRERLQTASFEARFYRGLTWTLLFTGALGGVFLLLNA